MNASSMEASPRTIDQFIGAKNVVERVKVALEATWNSSNGCMFPDTILLGPGGTGKTALAQLVCLECAMPVTEVVGTSLRSIADLNAAVMQAENGCLFIDEMHAIGPDVIVGLLKVLQERMLFLTSRDGKVKPLPLAPFCFIGATTDEFSIPSTILDRARMILRLDFYSIEEMTTLIDRRARSGGIPLDNGVAAMVAARSKGVPRIAIRLLESCQRTMLAGGVGSLSAAIFQRTCELEQIDCLGLAGHEQRYLQLLKNAGGMLRLNVIASHLGLPRATLERHIEPFLIREMLIEKDDGGRVLTVRGRQHIDGSASAVE